MNTDTKYRLKSRCPRPLWKALTGIYRGFMRFGLKTEMTFAPGKMKVWCPCCGLRLENFSEWDYMALSDLYDRSLFEGTRQDVQCPYCASNPRHRILALWCEAHKDLFSSKDILYFAPERGMSRWFKKKKIRVTTADLFDPDADLKLDIQKTGLNEASYDIVICNHVLEHVGDFRKALSEIRRILRPGGFLICSFPISPDVEYVLEDPSVTTDEERLKLYGQSDHVRLFGMKADSFIEEAGFEVSVIDGKDYPDEIVPVTAPGKYDINRLFLCKVR